MALPSKSDMRVEQMVTFVTDAEKLRYVGQCYYVENPITLMENFSEASPQGEEQARGFYMAALRCSHFLR